jgi:ribosome recycling factor
MLDDSFRLLLDDADDKMNKALEHLRLELTTIRAGRASPAMLEHLRVDYYGTPTPLSQLAGVNAPQPDLLVVQPWDASALAAIERSIMTSDMGLNPSNDGSIIRVPIPPLSEERRRDLVKAARVRGEEAKVAIRNIRRHSREEIKTTQTEENLPEDMRYECEDELQKLTDGHVETIDEYLEHKEAEIMEV